MTLEPKLLTARLGLSYALSIHLYFLDSSTPESSLSRVNRIVLKLFLFSQGKEDFSSSFPQTRLFLL